MGVARGRSGRTVAEDPHRLSWHIEETGQTSDIQSTPIILGVTTSLRWTVWLATDDDGFIYVADVFRRIQKFPP